MLKLRVITALVLLPLALYAILFLDNQSFAAVIGVVTLIAAYEWAGFAKFPSVLAKLAYVVIVATVIYSLWLINFVISPMVMNAVSAGFWLLALLLIFAYPGSASFWKDRPPMIAVLGLILLTMTWYSLTAIHAISAVQIGEGQITGPYLLLSVMMLVWAADTGAYFSGRRFGKNKLAPAISPGKSREGVYGGMLLALFIALVFALWNKAGMQDYLYITGISLVTVVFSVAGDLMESMFKRQANLKDSGNILPGHGGILDRIDSVTAAAPVFYIALSLTYLHNTPLTLLNTH